MFLFAIYLSNIFLEWKKYLIKLYIIKAYADLLSYLCFRSVEQRADQSPRKYFTENL